MNPFNLANYEPPTWLPPSQIQDNSVNEVLSRYHFMGVAQTRSVYSEYSLNPNEPIQIEKIIRTSLPARPEGCVNIRQFKLYFYVVDSTSQVVPLRGTIQIHQRINSNAGLSDETSWTPISVSNIQWVFVDSPDPSEKHNRLIFAPLKINPVQEDNDVNTYEIRIRFEPTLPINRMGYKIFTRGSDMSNNLFQPAMSVYFTTCPQDPEYSRNLLLEVISSLINIADRAGVYNNTEYSGAASKVLSALPNLRYNSNR